MRIVESVGATVSNCPKTRDFFQAKTFTDDLFEVVFGANLILKVELLLGQFIRPVHDLPKGEGVFHSDRYLIGDMLE